MIDDSLGRVLSRLKTLRLADDTVVIFTSDHGDYMGDHGLMLKLLLHYQSIIRPPFIWADPRAPEAAAVDWGPAQSIDISATVEKSPHAKGRKHPTSYLLTGILKTPQGACWFGNGRGGHIPRGTGTEKKHRKVDQDRLEEAVLGQVMDDLRSDQFIRTLNREAIKYRGKHSDDPAEELRGESSDLEKREIDEDRR